MSKKKPRLSSISKASTYEAIGEFWDTHDTTEYAELFGEIQVEVRAPRCHNLAELPSEFASDVPTANEPADNMLIDYDFAGGVRGKYVACMAEGNNVVVLDSDVMAQDENAHCGCGRGGDLQEAGLPPSNFMVNVAHLRNLIHPNALEAFCRRWRITRLEAFGSILRDDFGPASDVDLLVTFAPDAQVSLLDHVRMEYELAALIDRPVESFTRRSVEASQNPYRRAEILRTAQTVYDEPAAATVW